MSDVQPKPHQWLAWCASAVLIGCAILASRNLYPWFVYGFLFSNLLWIVLGIVWREPSLIAVNTILCVIYCLGLLT
jgi:hypothetical protein